MFTVSGKDVCSAHALLVERSVKCGEVFVEVRGELHLSLTSHSCLATNKQILFEDEIK